MGTARTGRKGASCINAPYNIHADKPTGVDDTIKAIIELGDIKKRGNELFWNGTRVGPRELLAYLLQRMTFLKGGLPVLPPWRLVLAVLAHARDGQIPLRTVGRET